MCHNRKIKITDLSENEKLVYELALQVYAEELSVAEFSRKINKSYRQAKRILAKIKDIGPGGLRHGNCGRAPQNKTPDTLMNEILQHLKVNYEKLALNEIKKRLELEKGIKIGKNVIYKLAKRAGISSATRKRSH